MAQKTGHLRHLQTPDEETPAEEGVCDFLQGSEGYGLCVAFCEAKDCDTNETPPCEKLKANFEELTGTCMPCDYECLCTCPFEIGECPTTGPIISEPCRFSAPGGGSGSGGGDGCGLSSQVSIDCARICSTNGNVYPLYSRTKTEASSCNPSQCEPFFDCCETDADCGVTEVDVKYYCGENVITAAAYNACRILASSFA